jgi:hypothetical protein
MNEDSFIRQLAPKYAGHLRRLILGQPYQPIVLRGGKQKPESTAALHSAIQFFQKQEKAPNRPGWFIEWKPWNTRRFGNQLWPETITVLTEEDLLYLLGKEQEIVRFRSRLDQLTSWKPSIRDWLIENPSRILAHDPDWPEICKVIDHFLQHDVSAFYIRSLPIPVHSKFIEQKRGIIYSLLSFLDPARFPKDGNDLETAAGLRILPHLYPMRWLDAELSRQYTAGLDTLALPYDALRQSNWKVPEIWVVENETNLYLLPPRKRALGIYARGHALHNLKNIPFFLDTKLFYWGDLDEDGFGMLYQFRKYYPQTISVLMDESTVLHHRQYLQKIPFRSNHPEHALSPEEKAAYLYLWKEQGRIEQEKLEQLFVQQYIKNIT